MPKKEKKYVSSMKEALETFDLKIFKKWVAKYNPLMWEQFKYADEKVQMATMCKCICNRTDMLATEAHKKAVRWLRDNNMKGGLF